MKPGYKTTEFWLSLIATVLGFVMASGLVIEGSQVAQYIGGAMAILAQLGYTGSRTIQKKNAGPDSQDSGGDS